MYVILNRPVHATFNPAGELQFVARVLLKADILIRYTASFAFFEAIWEVGKSSSFFLSLMNSSVLRFVIANTRYRQA